ncbi:P-loop containing nucleoside triphosphate hydrolase protein [Penicillium coprophilum]|uniref:P-loop containing nucleoside triphosphate hydrolase protein n=1 Tax=Penicillium coprophilum TaxID=36646 RepID=UPI0023881DE5|nr:P-loop containing nucleoside triphosphate hydrolase protein [Penicillium coprophilum]KAJ5158516.1 P-loop containing nucleoside triphosphate hydrolase protein [Penicillium coprophilum]
MGVDLAQVGISTFNIVGNLTMALVYSWKLALVSLAGAGPIGVFSSYIRFRYELQFEEMNGTVFAESSQFASEAIGAFRTVTSLTLEDSISDRFETLCQWYVTSAYRKARWVSIILGFSESEYCIRTYPTSEGSSIVSLPEKHGFPIQDGGVTIEIWDLSLKYPGRKVPILDGLNMQIGKGQFAALVGASGSGKTSIISLIERFFEPEKGQILFNGTDISDINMYAWGMHLSLVAQEPTLFQGTIQDNILLGMGEASVTDEQVHAACQEASIHDFIISLPEGYGNNIGSRGITLSGGQKQRLAIARALIRNPGVLLLDEATSSLDPESERLVQVSLERAARERTMIAVAHRLTTSQNADVIFVLGEGGNVLEKGSHIELLGQRGVYYQMCQNQALDQ